MVFTKRSVKAMHEYAETLIHMVTRNQREDEGVQDCLSVSVVSLIHCNDGLQKKDLHTCNAEGRGELL